MDNSPLISYEIMGGFFSPCCACKHVMRCWVVGRSSRCVVSIGMQQLLPLCSHRRRLALIALTRMSLLDKKLRLLASVRPKRVTRTRVRCGRGGGISIKRRSNVIRSRAPRKQSSLWHLPAKYCRQGHSFHSTSPPPAFAPYMSRCD